MTAVDLFHAATRVMGVSEYLLLTLTEVRELAQATSSVI